jgi:hypothetical protein
MARENRLVSTAIIVHLLALSSIGNIGTYDDVIVIIYSAKDLKVLFMSRASMKKALMVI